MIDVIVKKVESIMKSGIERYAESYDTPSENVQIRIKVIPEIGVVYAMCKDFKEVEEVTFLNIMNKKMDWLGYEQLSRPVMTKILEDFAKENQTEVNEVTCFVFKYHKTVAIAFYLGFKNMKTIPLEKQLNQMELEI